MGGICRGVSGRDDPQSVDDIGKRKDKQGASKRSRTNQKRSCILHDAPIIRTEAKKAKSATGTISDINAGNRMDRISRIKEMGRG